MKTIPDSSEKGWSYKTVYVLRAGTQVFPLMHDKKRESLDPVLGEDWQAGCVTLVKDVRFRASDVTEWDDRQMWRGRKPAGSRPIHSIVRWPGKKWPSSEVRTIAGQKTPYFVVALSDITAMAKPKAKKPKKPTPKKAKSKK